MRIIGYFDDHFEPSAPFLRVVLRSKSLGLSYPLGFHVDTGSSVTIVFDKDIELLGIDVSKLGKAERNVGGVGGVEFTDHAMLKFKILRRLGFSVSMRQVVSVVENPERVDAGWKGRFIASAKLNREYVLRVVYEKVGDRKLVVTFYPARRERYEG